MLCPDCSHWHPLPGIGRIRHRPLPAARERAYDGPLWGWCDVWGERRNIHGRRDCLTAAEIGQAAHCVHHTLAQPRDQMRLFGEET